MNPLFRIWDKMDKMNFRPPPKKNISRKMLLPANVIRPRKFIVYGRSLRSLDAIRMTNFDDINIHVAKHANDPQVVHAKHAG